MELAETPEQITVIVNKRILELSTPARVENGTTLVPLRSIFESFNTTPAWDKETQTITAEKNGVKIWLQLNNKKAKIGNKEVTLNVPAKSYKGNTLVPLRFISEAFGIEPKWDSAEGIVTINESNDPISIDNSNIDNYFNFTYKGVKDKYGKASYDDYYNGGRVLSYRQLSLGFSFQGIETALNDKVYGMLISGDTSAWGIKKGMSIDEVKQILGTPDSEGQDESGEDYEWYLYYKIGKYSVWINSYGSEEPVELINIINK
jgi:hypothetical protein